MNIIALKAQTPSFTKFSFSRENIPAGYLWKAAKLNEV